MIVISNGFNKFHMAAVAAELHKRGRLAQLITGTYPKGWVRAALQWPLINGNRKLARLLARREAISDTLVSALWVPEVLHALGHALGNKPLLRWPALFFNRSSFRLYARQACKYVREAAGDGAKIYHYRAGFGHESVEVARKLGMVTLCDHSIAHPAVLQHLVEHHGQLPAKGQRGPMDRLWQDILEDIEQADHVLVNSDFVKETFIHQVWDVDRVHVIYLGVDDAFLNAVPARMNKGGPYTEAVRLLFAGYFDRRKGAEVLIRALAQLDDLPWHLEIAGSIAPDIRQAHKAFFGDARVVAKGLLSRSELAQCMAAADVFVFPSLAEGSARVVFEALACGCYVITTPNSGSIVQDGVHGRLVPAGDADALAEAVRKAMENRDQLSKIGKRNAALIRTRYRQSDYGNNLINLYDRLLKQ